MPQEPPLLKDLPWSIPGLKALTRQLGMRPQRRHGQNFLKARPFIERIVNESGIGSGDMVLEIGPGLGHLTDQLLRAGARVTAVEIDSTLAAHLRHHFPRGPLELIETDVLQGTHRLAPPVSDWLAETDRPVTVVANLPYVIASPLLALLTSAPGPITRIVVTIQREVAARLCAGPGNADYGALTVQVGYRASAERLFEVPAGAFWPKPAVRSEVVRLTPGPPEMRATDEPLFRRFVRAAFHHRRKKMLNSILNSSHFTDLLPSIEPPGPTLARLLAEIDVPPEIRADHLSIPQLVELSNRLAALIEPTK